MSPSLAVAPFRRWSTQEPPAATNFHTAIVVWKLVAPSADLSSTPHAAGKLWEGQRDETRSGTPGGRHNSDADGPYPLRVSRGRGPARSARAGGPGRDQHTLALVLGADGRSCARLQQIDQSRQTLGLRVAMHARELSDAQVLHARAFDRLEPGVADVQRVDLALERAQRVGERGEDRAADLGDGTRGVGVRRHRVDPIRAQKRSGARAPRE